MAGTPEGGKKAAATRGHEEMSKMGEKGGQASGHQQAAGSRSDSPNQGKSVKNAPSEMGRKGGQASGSKKSD